MVNYVKRFQELTPEFWSSAGGKGSHLAKMYQSGFPVPEGFVVLPGSFQEEKLIEEVWKEIQNNLSIMRKINKNALFAVRSSALSEDSSQASFAGEYETVLNVKTDEDVFKAIDMVYQSRLSERVNVYSSVQGIQHTGKISIVIQLMVASEISGVLFTADPITGNHAKMTGNFVYGLGEQLVSGESDAQTFSFVRPKGKYEGPKEFKKYAAKLYRYAVRLESDLGWPQDIEWAVADGMLYLLQTRPITNIQPGNLDTYEWNDTLDGDFIWVNTNLSEAVPDVMSPLTWSMMRYLDNEQCIIPGFYSCSGNICGRIYTNISLMLSMIKLFGINVKQGAKMLRDAFGELPEQMDIPVYPFTLFGLLKVMLPKIMEKNRKSKKAAQNILQFLKETPNWCGNILESIKNVKTLEELLALWKNILHPYIIKAWLVMLEAGGKSNFTINLRKKLIKLTGNEDSCTLLYNMRLDSGLASLDPIMGISKIIKGEMKRDEYIILYGHRGPHEGELSIPNPGDDSDWLDRLIADFKYSGTDVERLFEKKHAQYEEAWKYFEEKYPHKVKWLKNQAEKASVYSILREDTRSEWIRVYRMVRVFALKAGELTGIDNDVFFLYQDEMIHILSGNKTALKKIPARKDIFNKYKTLPLLPSIIRGRFDPYQWAKDPNRRSDYFDNTIPFVQTDAKTLKGFAGAAGRVKGIVRVLSNTEEGSELQAGEILVTATTNIGWTPLFPRAAAVITDIGAPLSHAAIVARELGIPAVVGCVNATSILKSGDLVMVDGAQGIVQILNEA